MNAVTFLGHLLNFCAPALWTAAAAVLCGGLVMPARGAGWPQRLACGFGVGMVVLAAGLAAFGSDGKMITWAALIAAVALTECLMRRAWQG